MGVSKKPGIFRTFDQKLINRCSIYKYTSSLEKTGSNNKIILTENFEKKVELEEKIKFLWL